MRSPSLAAAILVLVVGMGTVVWWKGPLSGAVNQAPGSGETRITQPGTAEIQTYFSGVQAVHRRDANAHRMADPLLMDGLRYQLEALLSDAAEANDPAMLKQRLAGLVSQHFPAALACRALAMAERYVDYRVALGQLRAPLDPNDPRSLRNALQARQKIREQFFDGAEYDALFQREVELDRYTLARLEVARNAELTAEQRALGLQMADDELSKEYLAQRNATTEQLAAATQTAALNAQNADEDTRHAVRSAQYGASAAHALAALDRQEQDWQRRLDLYSQTLAQQGVRSAAGKQLRQQLFTHEELLRIDAALAWRQFQATGAETIDIFKSRLARESGGSS